MSMKYIMYSKVLQLKFTVPCGVIVGQVFNCPHDSDVLRSIALSRLFLVLALFENLLAMSL